MLPYLLNVLTLTAITVLLVATLDFIVGYAGIFSLAHAVFFGIGAYAAANLAKLGLVELLVIVPAVMVIAGVVAVILALPTLRVKGEYFLVASLGLQVIGSTVFAQWKSATGGIGGILDIPYPHLLGIAIDTPVKFIVLTLGMVILILVCLRLLLVSSYGRNLMALRDNEIAAKAYGKRVVFIKTQATIISAAFASVAGVLYAFYVQFVNTESFGLSASILYLTMAIVGGTGTLWGPVVGAVVLSAIPVILTYTPGITSAAAGGIQQIIYGAILVLLMLYRPSGIVGVRKK